MLLGIVCQCSHLIRLGHVAGLALVGHGGGSTEQAVWKFSTVESCNVSVKDA